MGYKLESRVAASLVLFLIFLVLFGLEWRASFTNDHVVECEYQTLRDALYDKDDTSTRFYTKYRKSGDFWEHKVTSTTDPRDVCIKKANKGEVIRSAILHGPQP